MVEETIENSEPASNQEDALSSSYSAKGEEVNVAPVESVSTKYDAPTTYEEPAAPPREPTPDPLQEGGYLTFSTANDGTLFLQYSHHKIDGAIAYFKPHRVVPAFKYRQNHGKVELMRKLMSNKQGYFEGYADFLKAAKEFDAEVYIIQPSARVYYQIDGSRVVEGRRESFFSIKVESVAVLPPGNASFEGVKNIHPDQFISTGNKYGKAVKL